MYFATPLLLLVNLVILKINDIYAVGKFYTSAANKTYYIDYENKFNWFDAQVLCSKMNMKLVEIETKTKYWEVHAVLNKWQRNGKLWIGGIRTQIPNQDFGWHSTGEPFTYTRWFGKNPDFTDSKEFCVELFKLNAQICFPDIWCNYSPISDYEWNDNKCEYRNGFVCENKKETEIQKELNNLKQEMDKHLQEKLDLQHQIAQLQDIKENNRPFNIQMKDEMTRQNNIKQELLNTLLEQTNNFKEHESKINAFLLETHKSVYKISELEDYINKLCGEYKSKKP